MNFKGKTILIAGAAGFIPSTLAQYYLDNEASVIGLDNFITGSESNIDILSKYSRFSFYKSNIFESLPKLGETKIDFILSLASPASPIDFNVIPLEIMRVNSEGTRNLLELAKEKGSRFLEASTSEIYGDPEVHPQPEDYFGRVNPIGPRSCYDESKRYAEALTTAYNRHFGVDTRIVRIFNTYGPRMRADDGRVIPNFITQALANKPITINGNGLQTRSFCYVSDTVAAIVDVMHNYAGHEPINIGNDDEVSILYCAETIKSLLRSTSEIRHFDLPGEDPKRRKPCLTKLKKINSYIPKVSFEEGILKTANYFKETHKLL